MAGKPKTIQLSKLDLDLINPRLLIAGTSQVDALQRMMEAESDSIYGLARDIATKGTLNPSDLPIVIANGSRFIVVEGNRRLCVLKLLRKPQLAPNPQDQKRFAALAKKHPVSITSMTVTVAEDRDEADVWIRLKHSGQGAGEGTKSWGAHAKRTYDARRSGKKTFVEALSDAINGWYSDDEEMISDLNTVIHGDQSTNLERIIDSTEGRQFTGLRQTENLIESQFSPADLKPFLAHLLKSLATPLPKGTTAWSRAWGNAKQREKWMEDQISVTPDASRRSSSFDHKSPELPAGQPPVQSTPDSKKQTPTPKPQPGPMNPFDRPTLNFDGFIVHSDYPAPIHVLVSEVKNLKITDFPNTTFDILRTLVEKTIKAYSNLQDAPITTRRGAFVQFSDCLNWLESHMDTNEELKQHKRSIRQIQSSATNFVITADAYNAANHDHNVAYGESAVREAWNSLHGIMKVLLRTGPEKS